MLRAFSVGDGSLAQLGQQGSDIYSGGYDQMTEGLGMRIDGNLLYAADYRNGLYIFDVSNPAAMYVRGYYYPGDFWQYVDVDVANGIAYAALENGGLVSLGVSEAEVTVPTPQPTQPVAPMTTPLQNQTEDSSVEALPVQPAQSESDVLQESQNSSATDTGGNEAEARRGTAFQPWVLLVAVGLIAAVIAGLVMVRRKKPHSG